MLVVFTTLGTKGHAKGSHTPFNVVSNLTLDTRTAYFFGSRELKNTNTATGHIFASVFFSL